MSRERAKLVGDTEASGPQNWVSEFGKGSCQVLMTLHAISPDAMTTYSERLSALFAEGDAFREIWCTDGMAWIEMRDVPGAKFGQLGQLLQFRIARSSSAPTVRNTQ
jgi:hypothetical protein